MRQLQQLQQMHVVSPVFSPGGRPIGGEFPSPMFSPSPFHVMGGGGGDFSGGMDSPYTPAGASAGALSATRIRGIRNRIRDAFKKDRNSRKGSEM